MEQGVYGLGYGFVGTLTCEATTNLIDQGLLCYRTDVEEVTRIVVLHDEELKYLILYESHDTAVSGHLGLKKTNVIVIQCSWWPQLYKWVITYVSTCETVTSRGGAAS